MKEVYDLIILGAGPAGLSSGIYGARAKLNTLIIEKKKTGGLITTTNEIDNYPGSLKNETGLSLMTRMKEQCIDFGVNFTQDYIEALEIYDDIKVLISKNNEYKCKALIIATGCSPKELNICKEKELLGKGISYCSICDGDFFEDLEVFVVGSGESAAKESLFLSKYARKVNIICRGNILKSSRYIKDKIFKNKKINVLYNKQITEIDGNGILEKIVLEDIVTKEIKEYKANKDDGMIGLFIFIGLKPQTELFKNNLKLDDKGYILGDENMKTNIDGIFVAGDCRSKVLRQVVTATNDGAIAAIMAEEYINDNFIRC
ncbi:MAG: thioredoxin-disulfide reductase [Peptostreptococcaceae bacterium]